MRKLFLIFACAGLCLLLAGCGDQVSFTWAVDEVPKNLDPQLAQESPELIAVTNLYSGLVRLDQDGEPQLECATDFEVSNNGLTYTFHLKEGLVYNKVKEQTQEYPLTAHDFVFAFQRVFRSETGSPYVSSFACIQNSQQVLAGELPESALGVTAPDDYTLEITLSERDDFFLEKLALPGAMPCNQAFFESTEGAYGLARRHTLANGSFYLYNWNTNGLFLRRSAQGDRVTSLRLVKSSNADEAASSSSGSSSAPLSGEAKVQAGSVTAALSDSAQIQGLSSLPFTATTWTVLFNCENEYLSQLAIRQALASVAAKTMEGDLPQGLIHAEGLIPPVVDIGGGSYREKAGAVLPGQGDAMELCRSGLAGLEKSQLSGITLLVPQGEPYSSLASTLNQAWQKELGAFGAYFSVREVPLAELKNQVEAGNYQIALMPFEVTSNNAYSLLARLELANWGNQAFAQQLTELSLLGQPTAAQVRELEEFAISASIAVPLCHQDRALVVAPGVQGLIFQPFGPVLDLTYTTLKK